jgi:hypothetical protein
MYDLNCIDNQSCTVSEIQWIQRLDAIHQLRLLKSKAFLQGKEKVKLSQPFVCAVLVHLKLEQLKASMKHKYLHTELGCVSTMY